MCVLGAEKIIKGKMGEKYKLYFSTLELSPQLVKVLYL